MEEQGWNGQPGQEPDGVRPATPYVPPPVPPQRGPVPPVEYAQPQQYAQPQYAHPQQYAQPQYAQTGQAPYVQQPHPAAGPATMQYAPGAPYAQPAPRPSLGSTLRLTTDDVRTALTVSASALLPALGGLTVVVAIVAGSSLDSGHSGSLADWLRTAVALLVMAVGGRLTIDGSLGSSAASAELTVGLRLVPLLVTVVVVALAARVSLRAERRSPSVGMQQLLARAGLAGLVAAVGTLLVAAVSRSSDVYGVDLDKDLDVVRTGGSVGAGLLGAFLGAGLVVFAAAAIARLAVSPRVPLPGALGALRGSADLATALRVLRTFAVGLAAAGALAVVVYYLDRALFSDDFEGGQFAAFFGTLFFSVNAVAVAILGALGVPITWSANSGAVGGLVGDLGLGRSSSAHSAGSWTLFDQPVLLLALLVPVVVVLVTAVRRTLRQIPFVVPGRAVGYGAAVGALGGLALALLVHVSGSTDVSGSTGFGSLHGDGSAGFGFSVLWAPLLAAAWCALAVWAARFGGTLALSLPAPLVRRIGGRKIAPHWAAALAGAAPAPAGHRSRGVRVTALAAVVVAALGLLGTGVVALLNGTVYTPQAAVKSYLTAVASGNVSGVVSRLSSPPQGSKAAGVLLGDAVRSSKDFVPISGFTVGKAREYGSHSATVQVSYRIGSARHTGSVDLVRGGDDLGLLHTWKVADSLAAVTVDSGDGLRASIAGSSLGGGTYYALPGRYTFHPVDSDYLTADATGVEVGLGGTASVSFDAHLRSDVEDTASTAVQAQLQQCLAATSWPQSNCPFLSDGTALQGMQLSLVTTPTFTLEYDESGDQLTIRTQKRGSLHVVGTRTQDWFGTVTSTPYDYQFSFDLSGSVDVHGGKAEVSFDK